MKHKFEICGMQILIAAATEVEIAPFLEKNPSADYLVTGVGAPQAMYQLTRRLHQIDYDLVIQAGIAGSFDQSVALGEVVLVSGDCFADIGIFEKGQFYSVFEKQLAEADQYPFIGGWLKNDHPVLLKQDYKTVMAITVNTVTDDRTQITRLEEKFKPQIESMEGAVLHYVCLAEHIPFIQVRSVSNYIGERDKTKWKMKEAIDNLCNAVGEIINSVTSGMQKPVSGI